ncbi:hypothetical protein [Algivirga pacifica]|uniref:Uncharacterized protein n=1 Tax=Algivirga pacifica TaxID=1162670 RepID=A0ABP9CZZ1_9BACT
MYYTYPKNNFGLMLMRSNLPVVNYTTDDMEGCEGLLKGYIPEISVLHSSPFKAEKAECVCSEMLEEILSHQVDLLEIDHVVLFIYSSTKDYTGKEEYPISNMLIDIFMDVFPQADLQAVGGTDLQLREGEFRMVWAMNA